MFDPATGSNSPGGRSSARISAALLCLGFLLQAGSTFAADRPSEGFITSIPSTMTSESHRRLRSLLHGPLQHFQQGAARQGGRFVLLCDFNPEGSRADCDDFDACHALAKYLRSLSSEHPGVRTVAYVHGEVRRHSVLPVLACSEIVFSEQGRLGQVTAVAKKLGEVETTAYQVFVRNRFPEVLVRKMFDPDLEVVRVGNEYFDAQARGRPAGGQPVPGLIVGEAANYSFEQARTLGLCQQAPAASLDELRLSLGIPRPDASGLLERSVCWRIVIQGNITGAVVEQTRRRIERALRARADVIVFELSCSGGDSSLASELGGFISSLASERSDNPVQTIAYVTTRARNLATFLAISCDKIIMQREDHADDAAQIDDDDAPAHEARLGGLGSYLRRHPRLEPYRRELAQAQKMPGQAVQQAELQQRLDDATLRLEQELEQQLSQLAKTKMYPPVLASGMCNRATRIHTVERIVGAGGRALMSEEDLRADQARAKQWRSVGLVKPWQGQARLEGRYLTLTARQAQEIGVAAGVVKDLEDLYEFEGISPRTVRTADTDWLDSLADFLRDPWTSIVLVMVGITCLILELKMPGVGLPGVLSAICFVLFFWAHSQLHGQITWLALLLFVLGLVLIALEVFVLPGFGVCGIAGILLVLASLGLVAYGHWPQTSSEWAGLGNTIAPFGISLLGSLFAVVLVVRYLPHIPVLNRLMARPVEESDEEAAALDNPLHAELRGLLGAIGLAATPLRPAGKTQFGDSFVDVVAEGGYIMPGTRVQVIEVEGNRVVVKEV